MTQGCSFILMVSKEGGTSYVYDRNRKSHENVRRVHGGISCESSYKKRQRVWIFRTERSRKIHHHENVSAGKTYPANRMEMLKEIGSFIEAPASYGNLTGEENLDIIRQILGLPKSSVEEALETVGLMPYKDRLARKYSLGMKQRLGLAGALIGKPPILILDEPTNGLDPVGIHEIRTLIRLLPQKFDCTVLVSSHLLSEVELMADDIGILNHGQLLFEGSMEELKFDARGEGFPTDNLEEMFLAMVQADNRKRGLVG